VAKHPHLYRSFVVAIEKAGAWGNTHELETALILQKYTKLPDDVMAKMARTAFGTDKIDLTRIQPVLDMAAKNRSAEDSRFARRD
jgi:ABC-type nitrate/sulfonate/bicarbonate transport system substrate-binding protein